MTLFENTVKLRGFLSQDPDVPGSGSVNPNSYAVLRLGIPSGTWKVQSNEWVSRTESHLVLCVGPFLCGYARTLKRGNYVEVEGELHLSGHEMVFVADGDSLTAKHFAQEVHATQVRRLEYPHIGVDEGDGP